MRERVDRHPWRIAGVVVLGTALIGAVASAQTPAAPGPAVETSYRATVREALAEVNSGNWPEARALFERAHRIKPNARTLRGLGVTAFELRRYVQALRELRAALKDNRNPLTPEQRTEVADIIARAERYVGKLRVRTVPANAALRVDGVAVEGRELALEVGDHEVFASAPGHRDARARVSVEAGATHALVLSLQPLQLKLTAATTPTRSDRDPRLSEDGERSPSILGRWWFWTAVGVVAAGSAVTLGLVLGSEPEPAPYEEGDVGGLIETLELGR